MSKGAGHDKNTSNSGTGCLAISISLVLEEGLHSFLDLGRMKEGIQWSLMPVSEVSIPQSHFGLTTNKGRGETVPMGDEVVRKVRHETNAVNEMNDDVYVDVLSGGA